MMKKHRVIFLIILILLIIVKLVGYSNDREYQNQYLEPFGIDFISTEYKKGQIDDFRNYFTIELGEREKTEIKNIIKNKPFYDVSIWNNDYNIVNETLSNHFTKTIPNVSKGYFSIYNKISYKMIDLDKDDLNVIDLSYYTILIFDEQTGILYVFDYEMS